jgi:hypothetical protein
MKLENNFYAAGGGVSDAEKTLQQKIAELTKKRESITAFNDIIADDRKKLEQIDAEINALQAESGPSQEEEKQKLFARIDLMGGVYSATLQKDYAPAEIKGIIDNVLKGKEKITTIPRSPIFGRVEDLRASVQKIIESGRG